MRAETPSHPRAPSAYHHRRSGKGLGAFEHGDGDYDEDNGDALHVYWLPITTSDLGTSLADQIALLIPLIFTNFASDQGAQIREHNGKIKNICDNATLQEKNLLSRDILLPLVYMLPFHAADGE